MLFITNKLYVIGILSKLDRPRHVILKQDFCVPGTPAKWVSIYNHLDWIRNQINNQTTKQLC